MKYKIYAGLSGGFGGATYQKTEDYSSMDEALEDAYNLAVEEYQSYEGCHGIMSWDDAVKISLILALTMMMKLLMTVIRKN